MGKVSALVNGLLLLSPIALGILVVGVSALPPGLLIAAAATLSVATVWLLFLAKLPKLRDGDLLSLGYAEVRESKGKYFLAYACLFFALAAWVSLAITWGS